MSDERHSQQLRTLRRVRNALLLVLVIVSMVATAAWVAQKRQVAELQGTVDDLARMGELTDQVERNAAREHVVAQGIAEVEAEVRAVGSGPDGRARRQELGAKMERLGIELKAIRRSNQEMAERLARLKRVSAAEGR